MIGSATAYLIRFVAAFSVARLKKVHVVDDVVRRFGNSVSLTWNLIFCTRSHGSLKHLIVLNPRDQKFWHYSARFTCISCCPRNLLKTTGTRHVVLSCCVRITTAYHNRDALDSLVSCVRFFVIAGTCVIC